MPMHCNAAGIMGGNSVCGAQGGSCCDDEWRVDCPDCLKAMVEYLMERGQTGEQMAKTFRFDDATEFWYRMGLKQVVLFPPDEGRVAYELGRQTADMKEQGRLEEQGS